MIFFFFYISSQCFPESSSFGVLIILFIHFNISLYICIYSMSSVLCAFTGVMRYHTEAESLKLFRDCSKALTYFFIVLFTCKYEKFSELKYLLYMLCFFSQYYFHDSCLLTNRFSFSYSRF